MTSTARFDNVTFDNDVTVTGGATVSGDLAVTGNVTSANQGLVLVKTQAVGTAVSSVTVTDAFSSTFDNYRISITNMSHSANQPDIQIRFGATTTTYYTTGWYLGLTAGSITPVQSGSSSQISFASGNNAGSGSYIVEVLSPYRTEFTFTQATNMSTAWATTYLGTQATGTSFTSFTILASSGTLSSGTIRVYGYNNG
jgi:hypothetical protein